MPLLENLQRAVGSAHVKAGPDIAPMLIDNRGRWHGRALCAVFPADTREVSEVMKVAALYNALVFAQGGNTGNAAAATPVVSESDAERTIIVSTARMRRIEAIDTINDTVRAQAGVPVAALQEAAAAKERLFAVSLASEGTATLGGILAANAGGVHVIRYGNTRAQCLGLEVVLADGRVLDLMRGLRKDNTGYDLKQLFIGSEGTLGIITRAVMRLEPEPAERKVAVCSVETIGAVEEAFALFQAICAESLSAFEIVHRTPVERVSQVFPQLTANLDIDAEWLIFAELGFSDFATAEATEEPLSDALAALYDKGILKNVVISQSKAQADALWAVRETVPEAHKKTGGNVKHDISVPRSALGRFITETNARLKENFNWIEPSVFGHFGDGNLHYNMGVAQGFDARLAFDFEDKINEIVYASVLSFNGSVAAEHGVGRMKRDLVAKVKDPVELEIMRRVKAVFDPCGRLNPGAVL